MLDAAIIAVRDSHRMRVHRDNVVIVAHISSNGCEPEERILGDGYVCELAEVENAREDQKHI